MIESSQAYQQAITADARGVRLLAVVDIIDPDMEQGGAEGSPQDGDVSRIGQLWDKKFQVTANYASLEPCRWLLDGNTGPLPDEAGDIPDWEAGMVGLELSGPDGLFGTPQSAQISFSSVHILQACSVAFSDRPEDGVAEDFVVEVFSAGTACVRREVTGNHDALVPITAFKIIDPDAIRVTVTRWTLPGRRMRVVEIVPGVYEEWTEEISGFSFKRQADITCLTLPYGTCSITLDNQSRRFEPRNKNGVFQMLEERQGIALYMLVRLPDRTWERKPLGVLYQHSGGWKTGDNAPTIKWDLVDIVGLLAGRAFLWPEEEPLPTNLQGWMEALAGQLGKNFKHRVRVDLEYAQRPVTAARKALEGLSCGDILRYVCMAAGTFPRADASTGYLAAEPVWHEGSRVTLDNLNSYPVMSANDGAAAVTVSGYTVPGGDPAGRPIEVKNPFPTTDGQKRLLAQTILSSCGGNRFELTGRGNPASEVGDVDVIWLDESTATCARLILQDLSFSGGVLRNCKSVLIRGGGDLFTFSERVRFLESGTFVVPENVWRIRVLLVGRGGSGLRGYDGMWANYTNWFLGTLLYPPPEGGANGENGADGSGGMVWDGVFDVNPGQEFAVAVNGNSKFGTHSSADGKRYPNGYTDMATGDVYARNGVRNPRPGSGDGGEGGRGGYAGSWYNRGRWYYDEGPQYPGWSEGGWGIDPSRPGPGRWEIETVIEQEPTPGQEGAIGASGCMIVCWEPPEVIPA